MLPADASPEQKAQRNEEIRALLKVTSEGRRGVGGGREYKEFLMKYGPKISGAHGWNHGSSPPGELMTVADEAWGCLLIENLTYPWLHGLSDQECLYSWPSNKSNGKDAYGGGWKLTAFSRLLALKKRVTEDRGSTVGVAFEKTFWDDKKKTKSHGRRSLEAVDAMIVDADGKEVTRSEFYGLSDDEDSVVAEVAAAAMAGASVDADAVGEIEAT